MLDLWTVYNNGGYMLILVILLVLVCLLYYGNKQIPKTENANTEQLKNSLNLDFKSINEKNIFNFGNKKLSEEIEKFGHDLVNGKIMVDDYGNAYTDYEDAK